MSDAAAMLAAQERLSVSGAVRDAIGIIRQSISDYDGEMAVGMSDEAAYLVLDALERAVPLIEGGNAA